MTEADQGKQLRLGWWVFIGLAALTAFEYWVSSALSGTLPYLTITAVLKGGLIAAYFMHLGQVWRAEGKRQ